MREVNKNKFRHNPDGVTTTIIIESKVHGTKEVLIDTEDYDKVSGHRWYLGKGYVHTNIPHPDGGWRVRPDNGRRQRRRTNLKLHRLIMDAPKGKDVDHIEHDTLDNRKCKLRVCSRQENSRNSTRYKNNTSGFKGVFYMKKPKDMINELKKPWRAQVMLNQKTIHIGYYKTKEEAAEAYDRKAIELFGKPVCPELNLNFPEKLEQYLGEEAH